MATAKLKTNDVWDESNEVNASNWVKFYVPLEDRILGTLVSKVQKKSTYPGKEDTLEWQYEIKAQYGSFHETDDNKKVIEKPIEIKDGEYWFVGGRPGLDMQMRNIKVGQIIGIKYIEEIPNKDKKKYPFKVVKVYESKGADGKPQMDEEFINDKNVAEF